MSSLLHLFLLFVLFPSPSSSSSSSSSPFLRREAISVSVLDHGAVGDGRTYDTVAIQSAIEACASGGGGRVLFPAGGNYLTATVHLRSGVVLEVERGARVLAGTRQEDYPWESSRWYLVLAEGESGVGVTGGGEINGQGWAFVEKKNPRKNVMVSWNSTGRCSGDECRPRLLGFLDCRDVVVSDIKLIDPAYWCFHLVRCDNTHIHDISIYGNFDSPNNDGIDIEDSNNTVIKRCHIDTGDDGICPKSSTGPVYNLTATDCWIRTKSSAIKLGSASVFNFRNFLFDNITIVDSHRGLGLQIRDGGNVSDITFSNIKINTRYYDPSWWGRAEPIYVTTCSRVPSDGRVGSITNLTFVNISATSENGILLSASQGELVSNLKFINVNLTYRRWTDYRGGLVDYRPGCQKFVNGSMAGMMMEHISGVMLDNVRMMWYNDSSRGWNNPLQFRPSTVDNLYFRGWSSQAY